MSTVHYRPDYAKFIIVCPRNTFRIYYDTLRQLAKETKYHGDWDAHHKVTALPSIDPERETTVVQIWGEWAGVVRGLPFHPWSLWLKRFDVRSVVWDASADAVLHVGQQLQRSDVGYNVNVYNTKPASKREGRSRGGKGFAIGSHKSDLRVTVYKRHGEPVAQEYQCQGDMLKRVVTKVLGIYGTGAAWSPTSWVELSNELEILGNARISRCLENAGIGTYWPTFGPFEGCEPPPLQTSFAAPLTPDEERELNAGAPWQDTEPPNA